MTWASVLVASAVLLAGAANPVVASASTIPGGVVNLITETKEFSFADESDEAFVVGLASNDKASPLTESERAMLDAGPHVAVVMTAHDGQRYFCELPPPPVADADVDADADADAGDAEERRRAEEEALEKSLSALDGSCFYRIEGWWTYEFCHGKHVRQYHQENAAAKPTSEFSLGVFDAAATAAAARDHPAGADERRLSHAFTGGTPCDLADLARETEVRFTCAPGEGVNAIAAIKEPSTCRYAFTFATPLVCGRGGFREAKKPPGHVKCRPVEETSGGDEAPRDETRGGDDGETRGR